MPSLVRLEDDSGYLLTESGGDLLLETAYPSIRIDAAFGSKVTDASYTWTTIHQDDDAASRHARAMHYHRGRLNILSQFETGQGGVTIADPASAYDPLNAASPYYPNVVPYVPIRAVATIAGTDYPLFQHYVEGWPRTERVTTAYTERTVATVDGFDWLALAGLAGASYAAELPGTRIGHVLDAIMWPSALRSLGTGAENTDVLSLAANDTTKALSHLLAVNDDESGLLFIDAQGRVKFIDRHTRIVAPYTTSKATFCDAVAGGGYGAFDAVPSYDLQTTYNSWSGTRSGGVTQTALDSTSINQYGLRAQQVSSLLTSDSSVLSRMLFLLSQFKNPLNRIESLTVKPGTNTAFWVAVLGLEIGDRITYVEKPPGFSGSVSTDYYIQSIDANFDAGPASTATFTFGLWPADATFTYWTAGITGTAGVTTRAAY